MRGVSHGMVLAILVVGPRAVAGVEVDADNDELCGLAWFHYAVAGLGMSF